MSTNSKKNIAIVLPRECIENEVEPLIINLVHPRTEKCAKFLQQGANLWELSCLDGSNAYRRNSTSTESELAARSLIFESDLAISSPDLLVCTPINGLFFVLPILYSNRDKFLSADQIQDLNESRLPKYCEAITTEMFEHSLHQVCETMQLEEDLLYKFSKQKFISYLDSITGKVSKSMPPGMFEYHMELLRPGDISKSVPQEMIDLCRCQLATHYICAYLSVTLSDVYLSSKNFESLDAYKSQVKLEKKQLKEQQERLMENALGNESRGGDSKKSKKVVGLPSRSNGVKKQTGRPASLQKVNTKNNKSLIDMFRKTV